MTLEPLLNAPLAVQLHVVTVLPAFVLGGWLIFLSRKGSSHHRTIGMVYLGLMVATSITSMFVHERMPDSTVWGFSSIHLLAVFVIFASWWALAAAKRHDVQKHRSWMLGLFMGSLVINGAANIFLVDGITRDMFFGG